MDKTNYSVLMSVYHKEKPKYLRESMESIYNQTIPTNDFVLVCDGPLNEKLEAVIVEMKKKFGDVLNIVRLEENLGLGNALNEGLKFCKNELVARMDSDDISFKDRCEKELNVFVIQKNVSVVSGVVLEFENDIEYVTGERKVPLSHLDICRFSRKRNPFNHPAVMFKKAEVDKVGGYSEEYPLFEDYYLWVRMLKNGCVGANISSPILYMRTPSDMYKRRGGRKYAKNMLRFHKWLLLSRWSNVVDYITGALPHAIICVIPNAIRRLIYNLLHR